jgi:serine/threonine protein phosphatase PrpC
VEAVEQQLLETNTRLREYAIREETHTIGSTVVALVIRGQHAVCLWAGDSRLYRCRDGRLEQISQDHALVEELVERGVLTPEQAVDHPHGNLVTRAVGAADNLFVDVEIVDIQPGDVFILCSDGLEKEIAEEEISAMVQNNGSSRLSHQLVERALSVGARDNVTVISVAIHRRGDSDGPGEDSDTATVEEEAATVRNNQQSSTRG